MTNTSTVSRANHFPRRSNAHVASCLFASEVDCHTGIVRVDLGVLAAKDTDGIIDGMDIATAVTAATAITTIENYDVAMGDYGRNVTIVLDGAGTPAVTVNGLDYMGQPVSETLTANGTTGVVGKKAFKYVQSIVCAATAGRTLDVGYGDVMGIPYAMKDLEREIVDGAAPTGGTFVAHVDTQTATSGDPRGTYTPHATAIPDGSRDISLIGYAKVGDLYGSAHYAA